MLALIGAFFVPLVTPTPTGAMGPVGSTGSANGVEFTSLTTYQVVPSESRVDVTVRVSADQTRAVGPGFEMLVPTGAVNLVVVVDTAGGGSSRVGLDRDFDVVTVTYPADTGSPSFVTSTITYSLADGSNPDGWTTIINSAVVSFLVFDGTGSHHGDIEIILPAGFGPDTGPGADLQRTESGDTVRFEASSTAGDFASYLSTSHADRFRTTIVDVGDHTVEVKAWPSDPEWGQAVSELLKRSLPVLEATVGIEWQVGDDLVIQQSQAPYLAGYGGWYDPDSDVIELGEEWDAHLLLHEVGHTWFHDNMFDERWITEGLADAYATLTLEAMGEESRRPDPALLELGQLVPLSEWGEANWQPGLDEYWAYEASWAVMLGIHDQAGSSAMQDAMEVALEGVVAYRPDETDLGLVIEPGRNTRDWRYFLDVVGNAAQVHRPSADLEPLFLAYVVPEAEGENWAAVLEDRADARDRYFALDEADGAWSTPLGVRLYMGAWEFGSARNLIGEARATLMTVDETLADFEERSIPVPANLEDRYERAEFGLGEVDQSLAAAETAIDNAIVGEALLDQPRSFTTRVGLIGGTDLDAMRQPLRDAAAVGDATEADRIATQIARDLRGAETSGMIRLMLLGMILILPIPVVLFLRRADDDEPRPSWGGAPDLPSPAPVAVGATTGLPDLTNYVRVDPSTTEPPIPAPDAPLPPIAPAPVRAAIPAPAWAEASGDDGAVPADVRASLQDRLAQARSEDRNTVPLRY